MLLKFFLLLLLFSSAALILVRGKKKNLWIWIGSYAKQGMKRRPKPKSGEPLDIIFCIVDHFEPIQKGSTRKEERERIRVWIENYPKIASRHCDSNGRVLQHTWFYPGEAYDAEYLHGLVQMCRNGYGDIEFHHHHHYETPEGLRRSITDCLEKFAKHGACVIKNGNSLQYRYGFIHGNMALDNSRFDDKWCGVNNELIILRETGCYADFSYPTAPCKSQTKKNNSIYYATDDPNKPKSHNNGVDVEVGKLENGDLMIIQGPLALNWMKRKFGVFPTIDNAEINNVTPGTADRVDRWVRQHIHVKGGHNWIFVKTSCHGAEDRNYDVLLGEKANLMFTHLEKKYRDRDGYSLHYVTARELYNIVKAAESGKEGDPNDFRDFLIPPYKYKI